MKLFDRLGKLRDRRPYCTMIVPAAGESRSGNRESISMVQVLSLKKTLQVSFSQRN